MNITFLYIIKENAHGFKGEEGVHGGSEGNKRNVRYHAIRSSKNKNNYYNILTHNIH